MMDPEVSVLLHCAEWRGLLQTQVHVELSDSFNRQTNPCLELHISEVWTERLSKEPWLFNGAKFRLHSSCLVSPKDPRYPQPSHAPAQHWDEDQEKQRGDDVAVWHRMEVRNECLNQTQNVGSVFRKSASMLSQESSTPQGSTGDDQSHRGPFLTLRLGLTCYKDYLGTNWSGRVSELCMRGEEEFGDPLALLAQPLGVGAVLCTADSQVVMIRRSQRVAEAGGLLDIPGGHPEPKAVCECLGLEVREEQISAVMMQQRPDAVVSELFSSVSSEIRDEVNIPVGFLGAPVLLGVALNNTSAGRPSAEFYVSCSLTSDEVRKLYWKGGAEANESTDVVFLSRMEVLQLNRSSPLWSEMCPSAKGAILLYQAVKPDGNPTASKPELNSVHSPAPHTDQHWC
uniref:Nudix (Nucleoside diphosphate linked moiety X)-type motif 22 n=1 Tax=Nothobranchius pienaari TaxID=704102 RepID=A0A1A8M1G2_9TELE